MRTQLSVLALILACPLVVEGQAMWRISSTPMADVTSAPASPEGFAEVIDARLLSGGGFVVADRREGRLHFFDRTGRSIRSAGGAGAGPGEFRGLVWIQVVAGDSVVAYDWQQRRFSLFDAGGRHVRDWKYTPPAGVNNAAPRAVLPGGGLLITTRKTASFPFQGQEGEVRPDSLELLAVATSGAVMWRRLLQGGALFGFSYSRGTERYLAGVELPFAATWVFGITPQSVVVSEGSRAVLKAYARDGRATDITLSLPAPTPITAAMRTALAARFLMCDRGAGDDVEPGLGRAMSALRTPTVLPTIGRLLIDPQGGIWVSGGSAAGYPAVCGLPLTDDRRWSLFNATGGAVAAVELPVAIRLTDIGTDRLLGLTVDGDDAVHVTVYGLSRR